MKRFKVAHYLSMLLLVSVMTSLSAPAHAGEVTVSGVKFSWPDQVYAPQSATETESLTITYKNNSTSDFFYVAFSTSKPSGEPFVVLGSNTGVKAGASGEIKVRLNYLFFLNIRGPIDYGITLCTNVELAQPEACSKSKITFVTEKPTNSTPPKATESESCATGGKCKVGDLGPGGGIIIYVASSPKKWGEYIEAAPSGWDRGRLDPERGPYCSGTPDSRNLVKDSRIPDATNLNFEIGSGLQNSLAMKKICPDGAVADAMAYRGNGLSDWFLPSISELGEMYYARSSIGLEKEFYWSSTVLRYGYIRILYYDGSLGINQRNDDSAKIRPIRYGKSIASAQASQESSKSVVCLKGKVKRTITGTNPKCPKGFKLKK
jgi:hypothetical protein